MRNRSVFVGLLSLMVMPPPFLLARLYAPVPAETAKNVPTKPPEDKYPSNTGAVNESGGSANTNGMNSGLGPTSSGSGTPSSQRAHDEDGISLGSDASGTATGTTKPGDAGDTER